MDKATYTVDDIKILRGLESIRRRPAMYFLQKGRDLPIFLLEETILSIVDPKCGCSATHLELKIPSKGGIVLRYNGRGMPTDNEEINEVFQPIVYKSIMQPFVFRNENPNYRRYGHLCVIGGFLAAFCYELTIVSINEGSVYASSFTLGNISSVLSRVSGDLYKENELYIVFEDSLLEGVPISRVELETLAFKLKCNFKECEFIVS